MIGKTDSHYKIFRNLPSTEFIPSSSSGRRLNESEGFGTGDEGGKMDFEQGIT
jgi:hypothetical protein